MRILLDTHILIWALRAPGRLRASTRVDLVARENTVLFSAVNVLEVAIKASRGRFDVPMPAEAMLRIAFATGFEELPVSASMALKVADLPPIHGDPFDRLLLAQALDADCRLYTADAKLLAYGDPVTAA